MERELKVLILADRHSTRLRLINLGDQAILDGLHRALRMQDGCKVASGAWKQFPYFNISRFAAECDEAAITRVFEYWYWALGNHSDRRARLERRIGSFLENSPLFDNPIRRAVDRAFEQRTSLGLIEALTPYVLRNYCAHRFLEEVAAADVVLFSGSGLIADHLAHYLPTHLFEIYAAKKLGKPVAAINQTVAVQDPLLSCIVRVIYHMVDVHAVREPISKKRLVELGIDDDDIMVVPDSAFGIADDVLQRISAPTPAGVSEKKTVAITVRGDRSVDIDAWAKLVDYMQNKHDRRVVFLHTCRAHDLHVFRKLRQRSGIEALDYDYDADEVCTLSAEFDFVVTDRYHAAIFAIMAGTPVVPVTSSTYKLAGLFEYFEYPLAVQPIPEIDTLPSLCQAIDQVVAQNTLCRSAIVSARSDLAMQFRLGLEEILHRLGPLIEPPTTARPASDAGAGEPPELP